MEQLYRWVKASEKDPPFGDLNLRYFTNGRYFPLSGHRPEGRNFIMCGMNEYKKEAWSLIEWLEPIPDSNQDELWLEIGTRIMDGYDNMDKQGDVNKELSSKYIIVKRHI